MVVECRTANGNCTEASDDGLAVQCVGPWAIEKHDYLRRYVEATSGARQQYLTRGPRGQAPGGAAFIDLFAGPGRSRVRESAEFIPGSPLIAMAHERAPFTKIILCDIDRENVEALQRRTAGDPRVVIIEGDCNETIPQVIREVPEHGLNLALVDPFGMMAIRFETIAALASMKRMDLLIHFPTGDMKRNYEPYRGWFAQFVGTDDWGFDVKAPADVPKLIDVMRRQLARYGYVTKGVRSQAVKNRSGAVLYHLVYASKSRLGDKIWKSIIKTSATGQREMFE